MEGRRRQVVIRFSGLLFAFSCSLLPAWGEENNKFAEHEIGLIHSGDLICRLGNGIWSDHFKNISSLEKRFSHIGIIFIDEKSNTWVIHASANDYTGVGRVAKEPLEQFIANAEEFAIYRIKGDETIGLRIAREALEFLDRPFDSKFDLSSADRIYCSELIYLSVNRSAKSKIIQAFNYKGHLVVAIDNCYKHPYAILVYDSLKSANGNSSEFHK